MLEKNNPSKIPWTLIFTFLTIVVIISITGFYIYGDQKTDIKSKTYSQLSYISKSTIEHVNEWRNNRLGDAYKIEGNQSFIFDVQKWLLNKNEKGSRQRIEKLIKALQRDSNYAKIYIIDNKFNIRIASGGSEKLDQFAQNNLLIAYKTKKSQLTDLHRTKIDSQIQLDLNIPLFLTSEKGKNFVGYMMIRIIPHKYLYQVIQTLPTQNKSFETLLIRREENNVLFLNELRHKKNTALSLKISLKDSLTPAVKAALGRKGIFEGIDYRGVKVLSELGKIPGTDWFIVTKVDLEEIYSPLKERAVLVFLFSLALIIIAFVSSFSVWRHQQSVFYKEKYRLEVERKLLEKYFSYLIKNANDIILLMNEGGKFIEANDRALSTYGYTREEFLELNIRDIRSEGVVELVTTQMEEVRTKGGIIYETEHRKKDGTIFPVEASSRTFEIDNAIYYQSIVRDITERRQTAEKIDRLNKMYSLLSQINQAIVRADEKEKLFNEVCEIAIRFGKFNFAWLGLIDNDKKNINIVAAFPNKDETTINSVVSLSDKSPDVLVLEEALNTQLIAINNEFNSGISISDSIVNSHDWDFRSVAVLPIKFENNVIAVFTVYSSIANYFDSEQIKLFDEVGQDISFALKNINARRVLQENEIIFRNLFENTPVGIVMLDELDRIISINQEFERMFCFTLEEIKGHNINEIIAPDNLLKEAVTLSVKSLSGERVRKESLRKRKDGSLINVEIFGVPIHADKKQIGIYGMYTDISERKNAEIALIESEKKFRTVIEEAAEIVFTIDNRGYFIYVNPAGLILSGYSLDELKQLKYIDLVVPEYKQRVKQNYFRQYFERKTLTTTEYPMRTKSGEIKWLNQNTRLIIEGEDLKGFYVISRDVTKLRNAEEALRDSETKLRAIFTAMTDIILIIDSEGRYLEIAPSNPSLLYKPPSELLGKTLHEVFPKEQAAFFLEHIKLCLDRQQIISMDYTLKIDNKEIWFSANLSPITSYSVLLVARDITERKIAEHEIVKSVSLMQATFESTADGLLVVDADGNIIQFNQRFAEMWHIPKDVLTTKDDSKVLAFVIDQLKYPEIFLTKVRELYSLPDATSFDLVEFKDDRVFERYSQPQKINGKSVGRVWSFRDITERKLAEEEIRKLYRGVEQSPATIIITDTKGNIEYVNAKFVETTGYSLEEIIGNNPRILKSGEKSKEEYEKLWTTILSGSKWRGEFQNKKKNGELFWELASISPIKNEKGEITHFIAIKEDITDRKRMIEELILAKDNAVKSEKVKTEFLAQMSHEIRTPINIILGFNSFIKEELLTNSTEELSESFDSIESASKRIMRTVDLVLNMSEIHTGTVQTLPKVFDLDNEVLSTLLMEYKKQAERKKISLIYKIETDNTEILADNYCVTHIFTNLIDNAVKYTEKGKIEIVVKRNDKNKLYVEVIDTGIGISKEFFPKLFDPFTQEEHGYSRKYEGNGLGLALVKNYCELNNAEIEVESSKGVGSIFRIIFN